MLRIADARLTLVALTLLTDANMPVSRHGEVNRLLIQLGEFIDAVAAEREQGYASTALLG